MPTYIERPPSTAASVVFDLLNPIPFGFFVGALIFDAVYAKTAVVMYFKAAAWLIAIGLVVAVVPRVIDLVQVWFRPIWKDAWLAKAGFLAYLIGVVVAIFDALVHSRDAYSIMPEGLWLSALTVVLVGLAHILAGQQYATLYRVERT